MKNTKEVESRDALASFWQDLKTLVDAKANYLSSGLTETIQFKNKEESYKFSAAQSRIRSLVIYGEVRYKSLPHVDDLELPELKKKHEKLLSSMRKDQREYERKNK